MVLTPTTGYVFVSGTPETFSTTMTINTFWAFIANVDAFVCQGVNPTAGPSDGSTFVRAGERVIVEGGNFPKLSVVKAMPDDGFATLTKVYYP